MRSWQRAGSLRGVLEFDSPAAAALCTAPALHLAASPPRMPPASIRERLPNIVDGCTVGAGHFNQLEVPDQVNAMIEAFLRHYVLAIGYGSYPERPEFDGGFCDV